MALTSIKAQLAQKVIDRVKTLVAEIRHVDLDLGQLDYYSERPPVAFPCLLFDFVEIPYTQKQGSQFGDMQFRCRLAFDVVSDTSGYAPDTVREKGLQYFEIEKKLYTTFQYWQADGILFNEMIRSREATEKRNDPFRVVEINFKATFNDRSAEA